jgi:hypothetical protein
LALAFFFFLLLDQKEANIVIHTFFLIKIMQKIKAERCFCPQAFTLARRLVF